MAETAPLSPPKKPRRWPRRLAVLGLLALVLLWFAPTLLAKSGLLNSVLANATAKIDGRVAVGSVSLGWFAPIVLHDVTLHDTQGRAILTAPIVRSSHSLLTLARSPADLGTFTVERPVLEITCVGDSTNLEAALDKLVNDPAPSTGPRPILAIDVVDGTATVIDGERRWTIAELNATATLPSGRDPIRVQAKGRHENGTLDADVRVAPGFSATLKTDGFPVAMLAPFVRRFEPGFQASGRLTADLDTTAEGATNGRAAGTLAFDDLNLGSTRLGAERLVLKSLRLPLAVESNAKGITIEKAELTCDVGTASFAGTIDPNEAIERLLDRPGLSAAVDIDLARLATLVPKFVRLREGTALTQGRIAAKLASTAGSTGAAWTGSIRSTALRGTRAGQPLAWDEPLNVVFSGQLTPDRMPAFDRIEAKAEFATIAGSGSAENFDLTADVSLDSLVRRLGEFVDLSSLQLGGTARLTANARTANGTTNLTANASILNLVVADGSKVYREPKLELAARAEGSFLAGTEKRLAAATLAVTAGSESADLRLLEPIPDLRKPETGKLVAKLTGDLERWVARTSSFVSLPKSIKAIGGQGTLGGQITFAPASIALDGLTADLKNARFHGYGLKLDEPQLLIDPTTGRIDRATGLVEFPTLLLRTSTVAASVKPLKLIPLTDGGYGVELDGVANANLARVQQLLQFQSDPALADRLDGIVAAGTVKVRTVGNAIAFDTHLPLQKVSFGPPQKPTWAEEKLLVIAKGSYDLVGDDLAFERVLVERPDGLKVDATGKLNDLVTTMDVDLSGQLTYDLATLEPQLKKFLGASFQAKGKDTREFRLAGRLAADPAKGGSAFGDLNGRAAIGWQSLKAYGFDVGASQLVAKLDRGTLAFDPLEATFGQTGKVRVEPTVKFLPAGSELSFARGRIVDQAKLTPAACADAIGYVLPAFARASETSGTISFDLDSSRVPLANPEGGTMTGRLTLHEVQVGPGPVLAEVMQLAGAKSTTFSLNKDNKPQTVNVKLENGWVHHDNLTLATKSFTMTTSGRVSVNGDLEMVADVPLPDSDLGPLLKNNPKIREALAKKRIQLPVRGTIHKPKLDPGAFRAAVRKVTDEIVRDLGKNALGGLLDKIGPPPKK
jgi:translocation and assembly module TamB